jgi:hypothetical protein
MTEVTSSKKKKITLVLISAALLLLVDYSLKVREYNHLILANESHEDTYMAWNDSTDIYVRNCTEPGYVSEGTEANCVKFISKSDEFAGQLFVQNNQLKRFFVAPWHVNMKYAYEDLSALAGNNYEFIAGWEIDYDPNGSGNNLQNIFDSKYMENALQYNQSLMEAKPFPGIFLRTTK